MPTDFTTGTLTIAGGNNITLSTGANAITISGPNSHAQQTAISGIANSQTTYTSGTVTLSELGAVTIRSTTGNQFQISVNSQTVQTQGILSAGVSTGGNTAGNTTVNTGSRLVFVGTDNISLSQGTAAGATTISIRDMYSTATTVSSVSNANAVGANNSRFAQEAHIHEGVRRLGVSNIGNTSGSTTVVPASAAVFAGGNNITLSQSSDAASNVTITISAPNLGAGAMSAGVSNLGNTAGATGITGTRLVLVGTNNVTLSQTTDANGGTVSISAAGGGAAPTLGFYARMPNGGDSGNSPNRTVAVQALPRTPVIHPLVLDPWNVFPGNMTANTFAFRLSLSGSTATMSQVFTSTFSFGIYTRNGSSLSLLNSVSTSYGFGAAATNNSTGFAGMRWLTIHSSQWSAQPTFSQTEYYLFSNYSTAGVSNQSFTLEGARIGASNSGHSGTIGVAAVNATSLGLAPFYGRWTATTGGFPVSIGSNELNKQVEDAVVPPIIVMNNDAPQTF